MTHYVKLIYKINHYWAGMKNKIAYNNYISVLLIDYEIYRVIWYKTPTINCKI